MKSHNLVGGYKYFPEEAYSMLFRKTPVIPVNLNNQRHENLRAYTTVEIHLYGAQ